MIDFCLSWELLGRAATSWRGTYSIQHASNIRIEAVSFAESIFDLLPAFLCLDRSRDVRIHPKRP